MKTQKEIEDSIKARLAEKQSVTDQYNKKKAEVQKIVDEFKQYEGKVVETVLHLNGIIAGQQELLPKPRKTKAERKAEKAAA